MSSLDTRENRLPKTIGAGRFGRRSILLRTALLSWIVVILALVLFMAFIIPYQRDILRDRLESTAAVIATSIDQVTVTSIVVEDYSPVIEHCLKVVRERPTVLFLVVTRRDGFSLVHRADSWSFLQLGEAWKPESAPRGEFTDSELVGEEVFHYAYPLTYSGIDWGWIHIGLSLEQFTADLRTIFVRTIMLGVLCMLAASAVSLFFARRVSRPILQLNRITERIAAGDLEARVDITTGDEVESLAHSLNQMTDALRKGRDEQEFRVEERTAELRATNAKLLAEIAERRRAEEAQMAAEQKLEEQRALSMHSDRLRSLGEMAAGIAHELNQPLVGVRGLAEHILIGMERGWELSTETLRNRLAGIVEQADRMVHIIEHVRMFAREAGKPRLSLVQVNQVVQSAIDMLRVQFRSHGLEMKAELTAELPLVEINSFSLEEVVLNLLNNARDAVEEKAGPGEEWSGNVLVRTSLEDGAVKIEVMDSGAGIPEDLLEHVFDPFFTTKDPDKGTGLGLSISRTIIEEAGGRIQIRSAPGEGAAVSIVLPAVEHDVGPSGQSERS